MNTNHSNKNASGTKTAVNDVSNVAKKIVAPSPEPSQSGDGKDLFRWAVRKGLINQQVPEKKP